MRGRNRGEVAGGPYGNVNSGNWTFGGMAFGNEYTRTLSMEKLFVHIHALHVPVVQMCMSCLGNSTFGGTQLGEFQVWRDAIRGIAG